MRGWASLCLTGGLSGADSPELPRLAHRSVLPPPTSGRPGTGSGLVPLVLPPEMLPIMGIILIRG